MFEAMGILALLVVGGAIVGAVALIIGLLKVAFKLLILPLSLVAFTLKGLLMLVLGVIALLVVGPVVLGVGLVFLLPLLLIGGLIWGAVKVFAAA
ncbi:MAG: hypothetical protein LJE95_08795 [Acidobacteria bacterium]|jgi:hypothetical protein|nr:hypothetical protein [Acidobacteriota bacterium]